MRNCFEFFYVISSISGPHEMRASKVGDDPSRSFGRSKHLRGRERDAGPPIFQGVLNPQKNWEELHTYITLHYITLHYSTLHYIAIHYITLRYIMLHSVTLYYITLHYIHTYIQWCINNPKGFMVLLFTYNSGWFQIPAPWIIWE